MDLSNPLGSPLADPFGRGIAVKAAKKLNTAITAVFTPGVGSFTLDPKIHSYYRVTIVGAGGGGRGGATSLESAGGGGALAITDILPVTKAITIDYKVGAGGVGSGTAAIAGNGEDSTATFDKYTMVAGGGKGGQTYILQGQGGVATGGDKNFAGGNAVGMGSYSNAGGGAGVEDPGMNGDVGSNTPSTGGSPGSVTTGGSGSGSGAVGTQIAAKEALRGTYAGFGKGGSSANASPAGPGGDGGGGASGYRTYAMGGTGGNGAFRIEVW